MTSPAFPLRIAGFVCALGLLISICHAEDERPGALKKEAGALWLVLQEEVDHFIEHDRLSPTGNAEVVARAERVKTVDRAFVAWDSASVKYVLAQLALIEAGAGELGRKELLDETFAYCQTLIEDELVMLIPVLRLKVRYLQGKLLSAAGKFDDAKAVWMDVFDSSADGRPEDQRAQISRIRRQAVHDLAAMALNSKKYGDVIDAVMRARGDRVAARLFREDIGKEMLLAYARAIVIPAESVEEVELAIRELRAAALREEAGSPWGRTFVAAMAGTVQGVRGKRFAVHLSAAEWYDTGRGAQIRARFFQAVSKAREKSDDANERAPACESLDAANWENERAVDYFRLAIVEAKEPARTSLEVRLDVEPKAWLAMGETFFRLKQNYEAVVAFNALRSMYRQNMRAQWIGDRAAQPGVYTPAVEKALAALDLPDGILAKCEVGIRMALAKNEQDHRDPWNEALKERIGVAWAGIENIELPADEVPMFYSAKIVSPTEILGSLQEVHFADRFGAGRVADFGPFSHRYGGGRKLMVKRHGGSKATENAVDSALRWLAYHQEPEGRWDAKKHSAGAKTDTAVTGLALLAFLSAGNTEKVGEYRDNVKRAVAWLKSKQNADGSIFDTTDAGGNRGGGYAIAIATMVLSEAAEMARIPDTRDAAQRAVNYCTEVHQSGEGVEKMGWRYMPKMQGDTPVTTWFTLALKSAGAARLQVNPASLVGAIRHFDSVERTADAAPIYWYMSNTSMGSVHVTTMMGCVCRQFLGGTNEATRSCVESVVAKADVPQWGANGNKVDFFYWYYGTMASFQQGGDVWDRWNEALKTAPLTNQRKDQDDAGSWDVVGVYNHEWGRVGQTRLWERFAWKCITGIRVWDAEEK